MVVNWQAVLLGFSFGLPVSVLFFVGLAWGMRQALGSYRPGLWLMASSLCRIAVLLAVGFWVTSTAGSSWAVVGYVLAFFLTRLIAMFWAREGRTSVAVVKEGT